MLEMRGMTVAIATATIVEQADISVQDGAMVGLIGRNGAGKTTTMRAIMGLLKVRAGAIRFDRTDLVAAPAHRRAHIGIGYMPEDRRLVPELSVEENIVLPGWATKRADTGERLAWIYRQMPEVADFAGRRALELSGGQQKLVALARALMCGRKLLLLDEPFEGVAPALASRLVDVIDNLKAQGLSVLLSESDSTHSADLVDALYVIERGRVTPVRKT